MPQASFLRVEPWEALGDLSVIVLQLHLLREEHPSFPWLSQKPPLPAPLACPLDPGGRRGAPWGHHVSILVHLHGRTPSVCSSFSKCGRGGFCCPYGTSRAAALIFRTSLRFICTVYFFPSSTFQKTVPSVHGFHFNIKIACFKISKATMHWEGYNILVGFFPKMLQPQSNHDKPSNTPKWRTFYKINGKESSKAVWLSRRPEDTNDQTPRVSPPRGNNHLYGKVYQTSLFTFIFT